MSYCDFALHEDFTNGISAGVSGSYVLSASPENGLVTLVRTLTGSPVVTLFRQTVDAIRRGNAQNRLELTCAGATLTATINGTTVGSVQDSTYGRGIMSMAFGALPGGAP